MWERGHPWSWEIARNAEEVHLLLLASDAATATPENPAPRRSLETSRLRVADGAVHLLRCDNAPMAMFTLTSESPFDATSIAYPQVAHALYLQRLAIDPKARRSAPLTGVRALRRAIKVAQDAGSDALRSETNPKLARVRIMLQHHGFETYGWTEDPDGRPHIYLQKTIVGVA